MDRVLLALLVTGLLSPTIAHAQPSSASGPPAISPMKRFNSMHYYVLDARRQELGARGLTYINLIGDQDSRRFWLYYDGQASASPETGAHHLAVLLKQNGAVVGQADIASLDRSHPATTVHRRLMVDCSVPMWAVDDVDTLIR